MNTQMESKDSLGDRMKLLYENRTRFQIPGRTYTIIRIDGKAFHTYTKGLNRPFDEGLIEAMDQTAKFLCKEIQNAKFAYVQSDEISILLVDFEDIKTQAWFDSNIQKMASISASLATGKFNQIFKHKDKLAFFDSRVFQIPSKVEVENYFIWRQQDATRNSIQSVAQSLYSHKELNGKNTNQLQEMIFQKGANWNEYDFGLKRGRLIIKKEIEKEGVIRSYWDNAVITQIFTQQKQQLSSLIPNIND